MIEAIPGSGALGEALEDLAAAAYGLRFVVGRWHQLRGLSAAEYADGPLGGDARRRFDAALATVTRLLQETRNG